MAAETRGVDAQRMQFFDKFDKYDVLLIVFFIYVILDLFTEKILFYGGLFLIYFGSIIVTSFAARAHRVFSDRARPSDEHIHISHDLFLLHRLSVFLCVCAIFLHYSNTPFWWWADTIVYFIVTTVYEVLSFYYRNDFLDRSDRYYISVARAQFRRDLHFLIERQTGMAQFRRNLHLLIERQTEILEIACAA